MEKRLYIYTGAVLSNYGEVLSRSWTSRTRAASKKQALNNLKYQYKQMNGYPNNAYVSLPGKLR